ncbi:MAG: helix-turn-helix domain-containing protein [Firmicutes bacterium]|nr:helix-turn-helix domain-containing protein [Bacillota bacterium]
MNIADRIQNLRKAKGISQEELADKVGVSRQAVSKWESEQSVPDIDKIIVMSDYFDVTTDYLLKGIETEKQADAKAVNASIFVIVATVLNFIGLILSCAVWYEKQAATALVIGLVFMALGCMVFAIGLASSTRNVNKAKRTFWTINIWLLSFIPLSVVYNTLFSYGFSPYPLLSFSRLGLVALAVFWMVYTAICTGVVLIQVRRERQSNE